MPTKIAKKLVKKVVKKKTKKKASGKKDTKFKKGSGRWKKGESGNPDGREKGSRNLSTILRSILWKDYEAKAIFEGKRATKQLGEWLCLRLVERAFVGDTTALKMVFERMEGKIPENINFNNVQSESMDDIKKTMRTYIGVEDDSSKDEKK